MAFTDKYHCMRIFSYKTYSENGKKLKLPFNPQLIVNLPRIYNELDSALPAFPDDFQVAKYSIFGQVKRSFIVRFCLNVVNRTKAGLSAGQWQQVVCVGTAKRQS